MQASVHRDTFRTSERRGIDNVDRARIPCDRDENAPPILAHSNVVRVRRKLNFLDERAALTIEHIKRASGLIANVDLRSVRCEINAMRRLDALDHLHDFIGRSIDNVNTVARAVGGVDASAAGKSREWRERAHE